LSSNDVESVDNYEQLVDLILKVKFKLAFESHVIGNDDNQRE
jgi:hypothetical protein